MAGVNVTIGADSRKASKELKAFEKKTQRIAASIAKGFRERIGHKIFDGLASAAREIPQLLNDAINTASDMNEEISKGEVIFGSAAKEIREFSKTSVESLGLSKVAAMTAAGTFGNLFKTIGMGETDVARMSKEMTGLAADLGSFHNTTTQDAITAIGAALRGESEPIRRYGVLLDDATLKAEALSMGIYDGVGALKPAIKAQAAYNVILKQTTDAQGDFARTSDGLAGQNKILEANIENLSAEIGEKFLPIMKEFVSMLNDIDMEAVADGIDTLAVGFAELGKSISDSYDYLSEYEDLIKKLIPGFGLLSNSIEKLFPDRVEKNVPIIPTPDFLKEDKENPFAEADEFMAALEELEKAETERAKKKIEALEAAKMEKDIMKEHDEMMKAQIHAERERLELLEKQTKEREKAEQAVRDDTKKGIKDDIAKTLADFGITSASQGNMLQDLLGIGFSESEAKRLSGLEGKRQELLGSRDQLNALSSRSSISAVSSMQRIGGGGGVAGEIDLQRKQTDLQQKMVGLLEELKTGVSQTPVAQ